MAVITKLIAAAVGTFVASSCLQGCGGSEKKKETTTAPPATATTTTTTVTTVTVTTTTHKRSPVGTPKDIAARLNNNYYSFDRTNSTSILGVTMQWYGYFQSSWYKNVFCHEYLNPVTKTHSDCHLGQADCRLSTALSNHQVLLNGGNSIQSFGHFKHAIVFDQSLVENYLMRCSYVWDGATQNKYNTGCGLAAPSASCDKGANSAFWNQCCPGKTTAAKCTNGHTCNMSATDSEQVSSAACKIAGGKPANALPTSKSEVSCFLPGPAVDYTQQPGWTPNLDNSKWLRENLNFRVNQQAGMFDTKTTKISQNNELVLDVRLLMPKIEEDPAAAVMAFVYIKDATQVPATEIAKKEATAAAKEFCEVNKMQTCIPVIAINAQADATKGSQSPMFEVPPSEEDEEEGAEEENVEFLA